MTQETNDVVTQELIERVRDAILKGAFNNDPTWLAMATAAARAAIEACDQSQSARIAELEGENARLSDVLDTERYKVAIGVQGTSKAVQGRQWLSQPGRGSYAWDDEEYQKEFGQALDEITAALAPLMSISQDWSDCPRDPIRVEANRQAARMSLTKDSTSG